MYPSAFDREREMPHHWWIYRRIRSSAFHSSLVQMPQSPTNLQTDKVCRHFTESGGNATLTDKFTEGYRPSAFHQVLKNIYWICHYHRRNKSVGIFPAGIFFGAQFPYVKPAVIFFLLPTDLATECGTYYQRTVCRWTFSVGDLVGGISIIESYYI